MRFIHCADIHLDSPLKGLESYESAPAADLRGAARRAFTQMVDACLDDAVDFVLIAGDLYDGDWRDFNTGLFFVREMARLREAGIQVFLVRGNHDAESALTKRLVLPENVHEFRSTRPETRQIEKLRVAIHGMSFATATVDRDLASGYPPAVAGHFNIGLLHTSIDGRPGHASYAPCDLSLLKNKGYQYWALGHVHHREVVHPASPCIVFPGNLQGRHIRETGPKGFTRVTVRDFDTVEMEHVPVDAVRWALVEVDATGSDSRDEVLRRIRAALDHEARAADGRLVAARVVARGRCNAHDEIARKPESFRQDVRAVAADAGVGSVWVEKVKLETEGPACEEDARERHDALGEMLRMLREASSDDDLRASVRTALEPLMNKLPPEVRESDDGLRLDDDARWSEMLRDVEQLLVSTLRNGEEVRA